MIKFPQNVDQKQKIKPEGGETSTHPFHFNFESNKFLSIVITRNTIRAYFNFITFEMTFNR